MIHPQEDTLLLLAYGELPDAERQEVEAHFAACAGCHARFEQLERGRIAVDWAMVRRSRRPALWAAAGLAAAAALAALLFTGRPPNHPIDRAWNPPRVWSAHAGYIAGGLELVAIDSQLTRLERETTHAPR
ncbi:MAG: zf-HC2 domain-containing protein [Gemmatimonadetes bacterium]|nr:zf-HC2 domain-containing protein [Gemmatimonadota bacterium]